MASHSFLKGNYILSCFLGGFVKNAGFVSHEKKFQLQLQ